MVLRHVGRSNYLPKFAFVTLETQNQSRVIKGASQVGTQIVGIFWWYNAEREKKEEKWKKDKDLF